MYEELQKITEDKVITTLHSCQDDQEIRITVKLGPSLRHLLGLRMFVFVAEWLQANPQYLKGDLSPTLVDYYMSTIRVSEHIADDMEDAISDMIVELAEANLHSIMNDALGECIHEFPEYMSDEMEMVEEERLLMAEEESIPEDAIIH